ncbi:hypothetical protein [Pontibacter sp. G13]|uniref:hypothetical protein n=1 Tax=Pontibacter sp. G13 TaxID=3074898 RepID=UPI00288B09CC|nr:hypothetical protein [Pontibacter sp. G13]WNJ18698.1 hypothetical protein RJD25_27905 [Pontibacter sp. G13]
MMTRFSLLILLMFGVGISGGLFAQRASIADHRMAFLELGYPLLGFGFPSELSPMNKGIYAGLGISTRSKIFECGIFWDAQQRQGNFLYFPLEHGELRQKEYDLEGRLHCFGVKGTMQYAQLLEQFFEIRLPWGLDIYQSVYAGILVSDVRLSQEAMDDGVVLGFGSQLGAANFPDIPGSPSPRFGLTSGVAALVPKTPLKVFGEFGFGPLEHIKVGCRITMGRNAP